MNPDELDLTFTDEGDQPVIEVGSRQITTLPDLLGLVPELTSAEHLTAYCGAMNHLKFGTDYVLITEPESFRARYEAKYAAEDPNAPFQEGVIRLRDFGHSELGEIQAPRLEGESVVFYVEDDALGIPYRVTGPAPAAPDGEVLYEPLPMQPNAA